MNETRISDLRQSHGWTQERLAENSGVGVRTIQRLEAGHDASMETLSLVAEALRVPVSELFEAIDSGDFSTRVESHEARQAAQQVSRDRTSEAWRWLYIGVGIVVSLLGFAGGPAGAAVFIAYWTGGLLIVLAARRLYLEPHLDAKYPLSRGRSEKRSARRRGTDASVPPSRQETPEEPARSAGQSD